jgi:hypothetical protein
MSLKKFYFYVGIDKKEESKLLDFVHSLNEDSDERYYTHIWEGVDNPSGYHTYKLMGTWDSYKCFLNRPFIKSIEHFEE